MVVKNAAEGWLTDPEIWTPWTCVPMPIERKCRRILHEADPRDLPAKNVILGGRKRTTFISIITQCEFLLLFY
jgi:hypothetical protein